MLRLKFRYIDMKILVGGPSATAAMGMTLSTKLLSISDNGDALVGGEHGQLIWVRRTLGKEVVLSIKGKQAVGRYDPDGTGPTNLPWSCELALLYNPPRGVLRSFFSLKTKE